MLFRIRYKTLGEHTHCRMFAGPNENALGLTGTVIFRNEEFAQFESMLVNAAGEYSPAYVEFVEED